MGTVTILAEEAWELLAAAEAVVFEGELGYLPYTDVNDREHAPLAVTLWEHAAAYEDEDAECAKRVALALTVLACGPEFMPGKAELLETRDCEHRWRQWEEFPDVDVCRDCGLQRARP